MGSLFTCTSCSGTGLVDGNLCTACLGEGKTPVSSPSTRLVELLLSKIADVQDRCDDIMDKCKDIFKKVKDKED